MIAELLVAVPQLEDQHATQASFDARDGVVFVCVENRNHTAASRIPVSAPGSYRGAATTRLVPRRDRIAPRRRRGRGAAAVGGDRHRTPRPRASRPVSAPARGQLGNTSTSPLSNGCLCSESSGSSVWKWPPSSASSRQTSSVTTEPESKCRGSPRSAPACGEGYELGGGPSVAALLSRARGVAATHHVAESVDNEPRGSTRRNIRRGPKRRTYAARRI